MAGVVVPNTCYYGLTIVAVAAETLSLHDGVLFVDAARGRPAADARIGSLFSDDFLRIVSSRARALASACVYGGEVEP